MPGTVPKPNDVNQLGEAADALGARGRRARGRGRARACPSVTTSDGRPKPVTSTPLSSPPAAPTTRTIGIATSTGTPAANRQPRTAHDRPGHRLDREVDLAGDDDQRHRQGHDRDLDHGRGEVREVAALTGTRATTAAPTATSRTSTTASSVSQRTSEPRRAPLTVAGRRAARALDGPEQRAVEDDRDQDHERRRSPGARTATAAAGSGRSG